MNGYQQAIDILENEYNSPVRQARVKNHLSSLRITTFVVQGLEVDMALAKVYHLITRMSRRCPQSHRGDAHKLEFLRKAVVGYSWSHEPLSRVATHQLTFQKLYGELEAPLQLEKEGKLAQVRDSATNTGFFGYDQQLESSVHYNGQGKYGRHPSHARSIYSSGKSGFQAQSRESTTFDPLKVAGCFNCGNPNHMMNKCDKPLNVARAASNRIEYYEKKGKQSNTIHMVLADLCMQLDQSHNVVSDRQGGDASVNESDDREIFETLISGPEHSTNYVRSGFAGEMVFLDESTEQTQLVNIHDEVSDDEAVVYSKDDSYSILLSICSADDTQFHGACIETGAQRSVIGEQQARAYCSFINLPFELQNTGC